MLLTGLTLFVLYSLCGVVQASISCYTCANDFVVWNWRHYFLKRNYQLSSSDNTCSQKVSFPDTYNKCTTSCFVFYVNGTDRETGLTVTLGVGRGCSGQFLTDEQYMSRSLGVQSKMSETAHYLPRTYDKYEIWEHWCFCAADYCNVESCYNEWRYSSGFGYAPLNPHRRTHSRRRHDNSYDYHNSYWGWYKSAVAAKSPGSLLLSMTILLYFIFF
ncbi:unnamed protein product [Bursaphelenchus xylophilus]|uniref:(pine wood nematode) hypothetical protein n=1 Tax=Bursaphelenchus xylophilus TaxID=6326 RepID=A0A1I7RMR1_BURXY|nr:unnamed protein product [Bursaphelenchus xylophilus]CAG9125563.1 unnamed protein product [Bursaphelenchus xylophilus]